MFSPEPLTPDRLEICLPLLKAYPFKPYAHYLGREEVASERLFVAQIEALLNGGAFGLWLPGPNGVRGAAIWSHLAWDSQQLGFKVGRLDYLIASGDYKEQYISKEALLKAVLANCANQDVRYLTARVNASDLSSIHLLERSGFIIVDGILTFAFMFLHGGEANPGEGKHVKSQPSGISRDIETNCEIRLSRPEDIEQIKAIAHSSYMHDRFHSDPLIPKEAADNLHAVWLENSCLGKAADAVIVAAKGDRVLGYVTCKIDRLTALYLGFTVGAIVLVATASDARRQGVAKRMTYGALNWFYDQGVSVVEIGTQLSNIAASRVYESCGFRLVNSSLTLRKWFG